MTHDQAVLLAVCVLALLCLGLLLALLRVRRGAGRRAEALAAELGVLRHRIDELDLRPLGPAADPRGMAPSVEYVITDLGREQTPAGPVRLDVPSFADIVVKETVVKAAALAHGVRRGLAPATRNRIRFEMKQEVRRARKQRRTDFKAARRERHARQRRVTAGDAGEAS